MLASPDRFPKNVLIEPVIIAEAELGNVERHVLLADLVERANDAALQDREKSFNRVRMDRAAAVGGTLSTAAGKCIGKQEFDEIYLATSDSIALTWGVVLTGVLQESGKCRSS